MGTDIHPAVEVRRKGVWRFHTPVTRCRWYDEVYTEEQAERVNERRKEHAAKDPKLVKGWDEVKAGDRSNRWDRCKYRLPDCFDNRNYAKFAVLGNVRNGYGFAGVKTFEPLKAIQDNRGFPADISKEAKGRMSEEHSEGWVSLQELLDYDFTQPLGETGVISERQYLETLIDRKDPEHWSGGISGPDIEVVTPRQWMALFANQGTFGDIEPRKYDATKRYYIQYEWMVPLANAVPDIIEMIEYLKPLVPKGGTPDDVRVVFDFDS